MNESDQQAIEEAVKEIGWSMAANAVPLFYVAQNVYDGVWRAAPFSNQMKDYAIVKMKASTTKRKLKDPNAKHSIWSKLGTIKDEVRPAADDLPEPPDDEGSTVPAGGGSGKPGSGKPAFGGGGGKPPSTRGGKPAASSDVKVQRKPQNEGLLRQAKRFRQLSQWLRRIRKPASSR
ncbi:hypothetical protein ACRS8P_03425 [Burkholderia cenocepacia]